jgi:hypothetical protein
VHGPAPIFPEYSDLRYMFTMPTCIAYAIAWTAVCFAVAFFVVRLLGKPLWTRAFSLVLFLCLTSYVLAVWGLSIGVINFPVGPIETQLDMCYRDMSANRKALFTFMGLHALYGLALLFCAGTWVVDAIRGILSRHAETQRMPHVGESDSKQP